MQPRSANRPKAANPIDVHVGKMVRARRKAIGMSQTELAETLGITFQQVQKYELGSNRISASKLYEAARTLKVEISTFFEGLDALEGRAARFGVFADFVDLDGAAALALVYVGLSPLQRRTLLDLAAVMTR